MGAAFDDEPNYFRRGAIFAALAILLFFGLSWLENAGLSLVDSSRVAQFLFGVRVPTFIAILLLLLSFVSIIRGLVGMVTYLSSCLMMTAVGLLVAAMIAGIALFVQYRPDLAMERVAERRESRNNKSSANKTEKTGKEPELRTFTAADGRTMQAVLLSFDGKKVKIRRADGKIFTNSMELYSAEDLEYISKQQRLNQ